MNKPVSEMSVEELRAFVTQQCAQNTDRTRFGPIAAPKELSDPRTPPALRASMLDAYTAAVMDVPNVHWTHEMADYVNEQCRAVLSRGW
jgi:hypothetical protein